MISFERRWLWLHVWSWRNWRIMVAPDLPESVPAGRIVHAVFGMSVTAPSWSYDRDLAVGFMVRGRWRTWAFDLPWRKRP